MGNSDAQVIAGISVSRQLYELVAPTSTAGIRFLIYASTGSTLVATTDSYTFVNSSDSTSTDYNIKLNEVNIESGQNGLSNGITYKVQAEVTITKHSGDTELRLSAAFTDLKGSQDVAPLVSVSISNTWALATNDNPSSSPTRFNASPLIGISGYFKKTPQFNGGSNLNHLDVTSTKFKIEYKVSSNDWANVKKAVLLQKLSSESLQQAVSRVSVASVVSSPSENGRFDNVVGSGPGQDQEEMIFFIPQQQNEGSNAFTDANQITIRISIIDSVNMWQSVSGSTTAPRDSNDIQLINKINTYDYVTGQSSEPWNSLDGGNLLLNIPVAWNSIYADSVKVGVKYSASDSYIYQTFPSTASGVQISVNPTSGTTLYYSVAYIVKNVNISSTATTEGLTTEKSVENKFFPSSTDYTIASTSYKTFNTDDKSRITFNLSFNAAATSRIDGVNVYFTSPNSSEGSNIVKTRIYSYTLSQGGNVKTIQLLHAGATINYASSSDNATPLNIINASGTIEVSSSKFWQDFDSANISFEAYRDSRVESDTASYGTTYYVESGSSDFDKTIWNVPKLTKPSADDALSNKYELSGGVLNIVEGSSYHVIKWPTASNLNLVPFTYDLTITENDESVVANETNSTGNSSVIPINTTETKKYTIQVKKVFNGLLAKREISDPDTIVFYTAKVDTSAMVVSVQNPSNSSSVTLSWNSPVFTGLSVTSDGSDSATFANNVHTHYIQYRTGGSGNYSRLGPSDDPIVENSSPKTYTLPNANLGTLYDFVMYVKAQVKYTLNGVVHSSKSLPYSVPLTPVTSSSSYIVSTIPSIGLPSNTPVLISGEANPTLLLDLNAKGLEDEGFISVVVVLTQDGTTNKPEGEQVLLVFPGSASSSFNFTNVLQGSGSGADARLVGGESATSSPFGVTNSSVSTHNNNYTLNIGTTKPDGRYGYSTLSMPSSSNSGFINSGSSLSADYNPINYMVILTTRRGTDIKVGDFVYQSIPAVQNVTITTTNGEYFVNFDINNI